MSEQRTIIWFSCGAASAVAAYIALDRYENVELVYCDLSRDEHPDNQRFMADIEKWLGQKVRRLSSKKYASVVEVFADRRYMSGIAGAPCTVEMKKIPRFEFQQPGDLHVFGFTSEETKRIANFSDNNHDLNLAWVLRDAGFTKEMCLDLLRDVGIEIPVMYTLGFKNNNCIGCVKATSWAYWLLVKKHFPAVFAQRAKQSREIGCKLVRVKGVRMFLDEMPERERVSTWTSWKTSRAGLSVVKSLND